MKSIYRFTFCLFLLTISLFQYKVSAEEIINKKSLSDGVIEINYEIKDNIKTKILVSKDNNNYFYNLNSSNEKFPLQFGNGEYTISIFEKIEGNEYVQADEETVFLDLKNDNDVFLSSNKRINWDKNMKVIKLAKELTENAKTDEEKISIIHEYIISNIEYDDEKINTISSDYIPSIDDIAEASKGICYDYAVMFAAMSRSVGIPTKLVNGYKSDIDSFHAWNQVLIEGKWINIDTTYDAYLVQSNVDTILIKDDKDYTIKKFY